MVHWHSETDLILTSILFSGTYALRDYELVFQSHVGVQYASLTLDKSCIFSIRMLEGFYLFQMYIEICLHINKTATTSS